MHPYTSANVRSMPKPVSLPFCGSLLREERERQGLTMQAVADLCAKAGRPISREQIGRLEAGRHGPTPRVFAALYRALGVQPDALLQRDEPGAAAVVQ
jgi:transcriptional regulator with XRE-family HTH domain